MQNQNLESFVKQDSYQVFLFVCPANIPFSFAIHPWFVVNKQGVLSRWEVLYRKNVKMPEWGHIHKDVLPAFSGIEMFPFSQNYFWKGTLKLIVEDSAGVASNLIQCIENSPLTYPYRSLYHLLGPNSNTYFNWVLQQFPKIKSKHSWRAIGKNYTQKERSGK